MNVGTVATGQPASFTPGNPEVGFPLRIQGTYTDSLNVVNVVLSTQTPNVINVNQLATGDPVITPAAPKEGVTSTADITAIADLDGLPLLPADFHYLWQANGGTVGTDSPSFTPAAAQVGQTLTVTVSFTDQHGTAESRISVVSPPVLPAAVAPDAPVITTTVANGLDVTVNWNAPVNNGGATVTQYTATIATSANPTVALQTLTVLVPTTLATFPGLSAGTAYTVKVTATNTAGTSAAATSTVTTANVPAAPAIGTVTQGPGNLTVNWTPGSNGGSPVTSSTVLIFNAAGTTLLGNQTLSGAGNSLLITGLTPQTRYTFRVVSTNAVGSSLPSALSAVARVIVVPTVPRALTVIRGAAGGALTFTALWAPPANTGGGATLPAIPLSGYRVFAQQMSGGGAGATPVGPLIPPAGVTVSGTTLTNLFTVTTPAGTNYRFQVEAFNVVGTGPRSALSPNVVPR